MTTRRLRRLFVALFLLSSVGCDSNKADHPVVDSGADVSKKSGCGATILPKACDSYVTGPCALTVAGASRKYFVVVPANYDANTPTPVVFAWHYFGATAQTLAANGFFGIRSAYPHAIYVAGQGLDENLVEGGMDYGWPNINGQDVEFAKAMLASLNAEYCVDTQRVFSAGVSYGAHMTNILGCQLPETFRAIAAVSGWLPTGPSDSCANQPVAAWFMHGDADTTVPFAEGIQARDQFLRINGCDIGLTQEAVVNTSTTCTTYGTCSTGNYPVVWCPAIGGGHNMPAWIGAEIGKFFTQF